MSPAREKGRVSPSQSVARVDDVTDVGTLQIVGVLATGTITWTYVSPTGVPSVFPVVGAIPLTADFTVGPIPLAGKIFGQTIEMPPLKTQRIKPGTFHCLCE